MNNPFDSLNPSKWETIDDVAEGITIAGAMGFLEDNEEKDNTDTDEYIIEDDSFLDENE